MPDEIIGTIDLTPTFHYSRHVEIVKRFVERVSQLESEIAVPLDGDTRSITSRTDALAGYIALNLPHVRGAIGEIMADDVKFQIVVEKTFPLRTPTIVFHDFIEYTGGLPHDNDPACGQRGTNGYCGRSPDHLVHTL